MTLEIETRFIKRGQWTDLDRGPVMGKTITTDVGTGNLVIAILAVLSTIGTAHLWHLVTFSIHQIRAKGIPSDALFRQQQAMLRTMPTPSSVMADTIKLWWAWRHKAKRSFLRSLVLLLLALTFTLMTVAASVSSSLIVDTTNIVVLVDSPKCGWFSLRRFFNGFYADPVQAVASPYADDCYKNGSLPESCNVFVRPSIPYNISDAPCPFDPRVCKNGSISLDSGLVDVGPAFGLNIKPSDGVKYRRKATCAVLPKVREHVNVLNYTEFLKSGTFLHRDAFPGENIVSFTYGPVTLGPNTYATGMIESALLKFYTVYTMTNYSNPNAPAFHSFDPIEHVRQNNSNLALIFVGMNAVTYNNPVDDPLFYAHKAIPQTNINLQGGLEESEIYMATLSTRAIGCQEQYEFCYVRPSGEDFCTGLRDIPIPDHPDWALMEDIFPDASAFQRELLRLFVMLSYIFDMGRASDTLAGQSIRNDGAVTSLPDNQWRLELDRWYKQIWAAFQVAVADYAIGPTERDKDWPDYDKPLTEASKQLCRVQKMRKSGDVVNISVFGLAFVVTFSCLVAILDIFILKFLIYLSNFRRALAPRIDRWIQDGVWQLQRRAYEGEGHRCWTDLEMEIPLTTEGKELKDLPITWVPKKSPSFDSSSTAEVFNGPVVHTRTFTQESAVSTPSQGPTRHPQQNGLGLSSWV